MNRLEQIVEAARDHNDDVKYEIINARESFTEGAEWADKNPPDSRMALKIEHESQNLREQLVCAVEALNWYALPWGENVKPELITERAIEALEKIKGMG